MYGPCGCPGRRAAWQDDDHPLNLPEAACDDDARERSYPEPYVERPPAAALETLLTAPAHGLQGYWSTVWWSEIGKFYPAEEPVFDDFMAGNLAGCWLDVDAGSAALADVSTGGDCDDEDPRVHRERREGPWDVVNQYFGADGSCDPCLDDIDNNCDGFVDMDDASCQPCDPLIGCACGTSRASSTPAAVSCCFALLFVVRFRAKKPEAFIAPARRRIL